MRILRALWEQRPAQLYPRVTVPAVLIPADSGPAEAADWAADKRAQVRQAADALARVRVAWLAGHHDLHAQQPDAVAGILLDAVADGFFPH
jgi:hypothetical protein